MISIKNIYKIFGSNPNKVFQKFNNNKNITKEDLLNQTNHNLALNNICLDIPKNSIYVIMGLSGSGKSTLLRIINMLIKPTSGSITIDNQNINNMHNKELIELRKKQISMVFQSFALFPHYNIYKNVAYGLKIKKLDKKQIDETTNKWIKTVGLEEYANLYPGQLSGGMKQRVGLARAFATETPILLMDEPFSALDPLIKREMQDALLKLKKQALDKTIVFITHDIDEALRLGDYIAIMEEGSIIQKDLPINIVLNPYNKFIKNFISNANLSQTIKVKHILNKTHKDILIANENTPLKEIKELATQKNNKFIIIVDDNNIPKNLIKYTNIPVLSLENTTLLEVGSSNFKTFNFNSNIDSLIQNLLKSEIPFLIITNDNNQLVGFLSKENTIKILDILKTYHR